MSSMRGNFFQKIGWKELYRTNLYIRLAYEFAGSLIFGYASAYFFNKELWAEESKAFFVSQVLTGLTWLLGRKSGCHLNPAVTLAHLGVGKMRVVRALLYVVVQVAGYILGVAIDNSRTGKPWNWHPAVVMLHSDMLPLQMIITESLTTFIFVLVHRTMLDPQQRDNITIISAIVVGLTYMNLTLVTGKWTGCSLNPARSLAFALKEHTWYYHWVYWVGPVSGGLLGAVLYQHCFESISYTRLN